MHVRTMKDDELPNGVVIPNGEFTDMYFILFKVIPQVLPSPFATRCAPLSSIPAC